MNAAILAIGDELVSGASNDTNSAYLARELAARGIATRSVHVLRDDADAIHREISRASTEADLILITGGLGPTADDLTRHGLAKSMSAELVLDEVSLERIEAFFAKRGRTMRPGNRIQAMFPKGAEVLENDIGTAPGIAAVIGPARVFVLPGVPQEMRRMFERCVLPRLPGERGAIVQRVLRCFGAGESDVAARIEDLMARGAEPEVGITVSAGLISIRITAHGRDTSDADRRAEAAAGEIRRRVGHLVIGEGDATLASVVGAALRETGQTLSAAESCTGGLIGVMVTEAPGASEYFLGGLIAYANDVKREQLGVAQALLDEHGAVSRPVAVAMAQECRRRFGSDWALSVTGIAGPGGGTPEKPVGLVFIGLAGPSGTRVERHVFPGDREIIRRRSARAALDLLRRAFPADTASGKDEHR